MTLPLIWFILVGVLFTGYALLDGFDLGVGALSLFGRSDEERRLYMNAIGPVWDGNEVWLLTAGGALFAAFPPVYATVFEGFYLALMLVLAALIFRAVSFEFRSKVESPVWRRLWDLAFGFGSLLPAILFGVALGNILRGIEINAAGEFTGTFLGLLNGYALTTGGVSLFMFLTHGALYMVYKTEGDLRERMISCAKIVFIPYAALYAIVLIWTAVSSPLWHGEGREASIGLLAFMVLLAVAVTLFEGWAILKRGGQIMGFWASCLQITVTMVFVLVTLHPFLAPSRQSLEYSLTLENSSSSSLTLTVMLVIALLGVPFVLLYQGFIYYTFRGKVVLDDESY